MDFFFLRRRKLGKGSTEGILAALTNTSGLCTGTIVRNDTNLGMPQDSSILCIRWGCTSTVPQGRVWNSAGSIHRVADKKGFRMELFEAGLCIPAWPSWASFMASKTGTSWVVRPAHHAQGKQIWKFNENELDAMKECCGSLIGGYYISEYMEKVAEYRVFVAFGRVVWVAKKTPANPDALAWNVAQGGKFENVRWNDWPLDVVDVAVRAHTITTLDFSGIDVMVDGEGRVSVLEANSAPSQTSPYRQQCVAKAFSYHMPADVPKYMPIGAKGGYLRYIHPALDNGAKL